MEPYWNFILGSISNFPKEKYDAPAYVLKAMEKIDAYEAMGSAFGPIPMVLAVGPKATKEFLSSSKHSRKG